MSAWNGWYHVSCNTYGTWLPGDPRGWRERKHEKHVGGDYKNPPPNGSGDALCKHACGLLKQLPVHLDAQQRGMAGRALVEMLLHQEIELLALSVDPIHFHLLGRFPDSEVRPKVGRAKKHAYFNLRDHGLQGTFWEDGSDVVPITGRRHQLNAFGYIGRHGDRGAWVWTFREGVYWPNSIKT